jgi:hypothetical protein
LPTIPEPPSRDRHRLGGGPRNHATGSAPSATLGARGRDGPRPALTRRARISTLERVTGSERAVLIVSIAALLGYAAVALGIGHWWISGAVAPIVALLLARRHRRARFSAYVLWSVVVIRSLATRHWAMATAAAVAIFVLQTPAAIRLWPRLHFGRRPR